MVVSYFYLLGIVLSKDSHHVSQPTLLFKNLAVSPLSSKSNSSLNLGGLVIDLQALECGRSDANDF